MKFTYIAIFLFLSVQLKSQSDSNDSLNFLLMGTVLDSETKTPINDAEIRIIGTDSSIISIESDSSGQFRYELPSQTAYLITVFKAGYLNARGKEHTIDYKESKIFKHEYKLLPSVVFGCFITGIDFDSTFSLKPINLKDDTIILYIKNKIISNDLISNYLFKIKEDEYKLVNSKDEIQQLTIELVDTSQIKISNHEGSELYWIGYRRTNNREWYEILKTTN